MGIVGMVIIIDLEGRPREPTGMAKKKRSKGDGKGKPKKPGKPVDLAMLARDEQFDGAIIAAVDKLKNHSPRGMLVALGDDGQYKVVCYDEDEAIEGKYEEKMGEFVRAALSAMINGTGGASAWEV
jgi:hypothetical protein